MDASSVCSEERKESHRIRVGPALPVTPLRSIANAMRGLPRYRHLHHS